MTLGNKFIGMLIAMLWAGVFFQKEEYYIGWAFIAISVSLIFACLIHYLDRGLGAKETDD